MLSLRETYGSSASPCPLSTTPVRKPLQHSPYHPLLSTLTGFPRSNKHIPLLEHKLLVNLAIILWHTHVKEHLELLAVE